MRNGMLSASKGFFHVKSCTVQGLGKPGDGLYYLCQKNLARSSLLELKKNSRCEKRAPWIVV